MKKRCTATPKEVALGSRIKFARVRGELTRLQVAKACKVTEMTIYKWETGASSVTRPTALGEALKVSFSALEDGGAEWDAFISRGYPAVDPKALKTISRLEDALPVPPKVKLPPPEPESKNKLPVAKPPVPLSDEDRPFLPGWMNDDEEYFRALFKGIKKLGRVV